jgi:hypothetical protein
MARLTTQQEIVLVHQSGFAKRQYQEKYPNTPQSAISQQEKLKEACWNGEMKNLIPELFFVFAPDTKLFIWQMRECDQLLTLEMAEEPNELDYYTSIDPYCFMEVQEYN